MQNPLYVSGAGGLVGELMVLMVIELLKRISPVRQRLGETAPSRRSRSLVLAAELPNIHAVPASQKAAVIRSSPRESPSASHAATSASARCSVRAPYHHRNDQAHRVDPGPHGVRRRVRAVRFDRRP